MTKNATQIKAAVVREKGGPFNVETLTLEAPRRDGSIGQGSGHRLVPAQIWLHVTSGYPVPHPIVLGHEWVQ